MRFGMIGAGIISESHLRVFEEVEGADAVCIADINRDKAEGFAEKYGLLHYPTFCMKKPDFSAWKTDAMY